HLQGVFAGVGHCAEPGRSGLGWFAAVFFVADDLAVPRPPLVDLELNGAGERERLGIGDHADGGCVRSGLRLALLFVHPFQELTRRIENLLLVLLPATLTNRVERPFVKDDVITLDLGYRITEALACLFRGFRIHAQVTLGIQIPTPGSEDYITIA